MGETEYKIMPGYFVQDAEPGTPDLELPGIPPRFGLIDGSPTRWDNLFNHIGHLNKNSDGFTCYKLVFFARHGQGYHNVGVAKYGREAWYGGWSQRTGDDEITWAPDSELTELGEEQARLAREAWEFELANGIPLPEKMYCSPLTRALQTWVITWDSLLPPDYRRPLVTEGFREENGFHLNEKRRPRSYIEKRFPQFDIDPDLTEEDIYWDPIEREEPVRTAVRFRKELDRIYEHDEETFIHITAHTNLLRAFLASVGGPDYQLPTGGILPMVLRQIKVEPVC